MTAQHDKNEIFKRSLLAARKRTLLHLVRAMERQALQLAILARQGTRRVGGRRPAAPFNPITQLRREIMPLIVQLAELAAGGPLPPPPQPKKSKRRGPRLKAGCPNKGGAAAPQAAPLRSDGETPASV